MANHCLATIVVPLLSQKDAWLEQCLISTLEQTIKAAVLVVTSRNTPDANLQLLQRLADRYDNLTFFERPRGGRFPHAINAGFQRAETARVGLLFSDDWLAPNTLEHCLVQEADIVSTGRRAYAADGITALWERVPEQSVFDTLPTLEEKASYIGHFFLFRRDLFLKVGGVDPDVGLTGPDDYDLPWTMFEHGASTAFVNLPLYLIRDHEDTRLTLRNQEDQVRDLRRILTKHGVGSEETERLVADKMKWYGVPCYVALQNPDWYRQAPSQSDS